MASVPFPKPIPAPPFVPDTGPTFTQIFNDTLGNLGTDQDGYAALFAALQNLSNGFGAELAADQAIGPIAVLGGAPGLLDPTPLDTTIGNYVAAGATGDAILADAGSISEPQLLTLPITPGDGSTNFLPPGQKTHDFGSVKLGSPPVSVEYGSYTETQFGGDVGDSSKGFVVNAPPFTEYFTYRDNAAGTETYVTFGVTMTPNTLGLFTAQFEYVQGGNRQLIIVTLQVDVVA
jgi:hypothetical protein